MLETNLLALAPMATGPIEAAGRSGESVMR